MPSLCMPMITFLFHSGFWGKLSNVCGLLFDNETRQFVNGLSSHRGFKSEGEFIYIGWDFHSQRLCTMWLIIPGILVNLWFAMRRSWIRPLVLFILSDIQSWIDWKCSRPLHCFITAVVFFKCWMRMEQSMRKRTKASTLHRKVLSSKQSYARCRPMHYYSSLLIWVSSFGGIRGGILGLSSVIVCVSLWLKNISWYFF